ncbi:conserved hypothetical protein [Lacticaseibacillus paracasei]|nr:conserved hypothetical protein [Lacticaseibacillus paracasei]
MPFAFTKKRNDFLIFRKIISLTDKLIGLKDLSAKAEQS